MCISQYKDCLSVCLSVRPSIRPSVSLEGNLLILHIKQKTCTL